MPRFQGVVVPIVTLFRQDGSIDREANARFMDRMIAAGVDALFVLGTTGEIAHLTVEERIEFIQWAAETVRGRVPLLAGVGDTSTAVSCRLAEAGKDAGVDGLVVVGPYFWTLEERHLYHHFRAVAEATNLPALLYNYPRFVGVNLSVELVRRLALDCPNLIGVKETLDNGTHMRQMAIHVKEAKPDFAVFCGHDDLSLFALTAGLDGMVSSTANFAPEVFVELLRHYREGRLREAEAAAAKIGRLVEAYQADPCGAAVVKAALHLRGWIENPAPRAPGLPLTEKGTAWVREKLEAVGLLGEPRGGGR
jgi:4-hydroxy-tetrahydrodipicolinate synthase